MVAAVCYNHYDDCNSLALKDLAAPAVAPPAAAALAGVTGPESRFCSEAFGKRVALSESL